MSEDSSLCPVNFHENAWSSNARRSRFRWMITLQDSPQTKFFKLGIQGEAGGLKREDPFWGAGDQEENIGKSWANTECVAKVSYIQGKIKKGNCLLGHKSIKKGYVEQAANFELDILSAKLCINRKWGHQTSWQLRRVEQTEWFPERMEVQFTKRQMTVRRRAK